MKKLIAMLTCTLFLLTASACQTSPQAGSPKPSSASSEASRTPESQASEAPTPTAPPAASETPASTPEPVVNETQTNLSGIRDLMDSFWSASGTDYEAFSALFRNTPDDVIQGEYDAGNPMDGYDRYVCVPVVSSGDYHGISCVTYIVTGSYPDTHMNSSAFLLPMSLVNGEWKLDFSEAATAAIQAELQKDGSILPAGFLDATKSGRNATEFGANNYMYLEPSAVYEGSNHIEIKFAWQDENGNARISLWIANGTDINRFDRALHLVVTDSELGEILDYTVPDFGVPVKAKTGFLYELSVPAEEVKTGTQTWGTVSTNVDWSAD